MRTEPSRDRCDRFTPLFRSEHYVLRRDPLCQLVVAQRSRVRFDRISEIETTFVGMGQALEVVERWRYCMLIDMRGAPLRNDTDYETAVAQHRGLLGDGFAKIALLTSSPAGRLQFLRFAREDGKAVFVTDDESAAFANLGLKEHAL